MKFGNIQEPNAKWVSETNELEFRMDINSVRTGWNACIWVSISLVTIIHQNFAIDTGSEINWEIIENQIPNWQTSFFIPRKKNVPNINWFLCISKRQLFWKKPPGNPNQTLTWLMYLFDEMFWKKVYVIENWILHLLTNVHISAKLEHKK